jgi:hypothetical protein
MGVSCEPRPPPPSAHEGRGASHPGPASAHGAVPGEVEGRRGCDRGTPRTPSPDEDLDRIFTWQEERRRTHAPVGSASPGLPAARTRRSASANAPLGEMRSSAKRTRAELVEVVDVPALHLARVGLDRARHEAGARGEIQRRSRERREDRMLRLAAEPAARRRRILRCHHAQAAVARQATRSTARAARTAGDRPERHGPTAPQGPSFGGASIGPDPSPGSVEELLATPWYPPRAPRETRADAEP